MAKRSRSRSRSKVSAIESASPPPRNENTNPNIQDTETRDSNLSDTIPDVIEVSSESVRECLTVNPIQDATMEDVVLTEEPVNIVASNRKSSLTRLKSINAIEILKIDTKNLRLFCTRVGISGVRSAGKMDICNKIVASKASGSYKELEKNLEAEGNKKATAKKKVSVNRKRFLNVLFSDKVRPNFAIMGEVLDRSDLDRGMKSGQDFYELIAEEYNKGEIAAYGKDVFPNTVKGRSVPPSHFQPIDWTKVKDILKILLNDYDKCFKAWKHSGFHDKDIPTDIVEMTNAAVIPFVDFAKNSSIVMYMHEYVYMYPNILDKVSGKVTFHLYCYLINIIYSHLCSNIYFFDSGDLPANLFSESNGPPPDKVTTRPKGGTKNGKRGRPVTDAEKLMHESFKDRNRAVEFSVLSETASNLNERLRGMKNLKRQLVSKYTDEYCDGDKKDAKKRMQSYFDGKKDEADGDSSDDTASILEELLDIEMDIQCTARDVVAIRNKKEAALKRANAQNPQEE